ncbi:MAG: hypothetical protein EOO69_02345 [Moraxellaceae bacterium]|nr:MAG: hypothetical protein EOO69_02345 [Moraxellaceae bacterium]
MLNEQREILEALWTLSDPTLKKLVKINTIKNYEQFVDCLYDEIDASFQFLTRNKNLYKDFSEDQITGIIVERLRDYFIAHHDASVNGHVDIHVEKNNFLWLGEAKIYKGPAYMLEGFYQLNTRYATGQDNTNFGGVLLYKKIKKKITTVMEEWERTLEEQSIIDEENLKGLTFNQCNKNSLCSISIHEHPSVGSPLQIRHMPLDLYYKPQDGNLVPKVKKNSKYSK